MPLERSLRNKKVTVHAFVNFQCVDDAYFTKQSLTGMTIFGQPLEVEFSFGRPSHVIYLGGIDNLTEAEIGSYMDMFGRVDRIELGRHSRSGMSFAWVFYSALPEAMKAVKEAGDGTPWVTIAGVTARLGFSASPPHEAPNERVDEIIHRPFQGGDNNNVGRVANDDVDQQDRSQSRYRSDVDQRERNVEADFKLSGGKRGRDDDANRDSEQIDTRDNYAYGDKYAGEAIPFEDGTTTNVHPGSSGDVLHAQGDVSSNVVDDTLRAEEKLEYRYDGNSNVQFEYAVEDASNQAITSSDQLDYEYDDHIQDSMPDDGDETRYTNELETNTNNEIESNNMSEPMDNQQYGTDPQPPEEYGECSSPYK